MSSHDGPRRLVRTLCSAAGALGLLLVADPSPAQDLDPRTYVNVPVNATFLVAGFAVSHGAVVTDPSLPLTDINATVETPSLGLARSFALFGKTAQAFAAMPYSWAQVSGKLVGEAKETSRAGLSDMRLRLSILVRGAPAVSLAGFAKAPRRTILGTSLSVIAPTGQVFPDRLINLGTNRWSFKPEFAVSQPLGRAWLLDVYAGVWLFTANDTFYPGTARRTQDPMGVLQAHVSYNFTRTLWAAVDATYYAGGQTAIEGIGNDDRQSNSRIGVTVALPVGRRHSIKLAASRGAVVRYGTDFTALSIGWQTAWLPRSKPAGQVRRPSGRDAEGGFQ